MTSYNTPNIYVTFEAGKVCIQQHSKSKNIRLTNKAWNKIKTIEATVSNYAEAGKEGRWFLDQDWYIHTNTFTFPKKKTVAKKQKGQHEQQQPKETDNKDGSGDGDDDSETVCLIHIRRWYLFNDKHRPGKEGLTFNQKSWQHLKEYMASKEYSKNAARNATEGQGKESLKRKAESDDEDQLMEAHE